jgi:outer membrane murein-binding lipoprotein Lpp
MTNALDRLNHLADRWTPRIVVSVIAAAFILSYAALLSLAIKAGYHPLLAWLWPLVLDGVVIAASLSLLKRQSRGDSTAYAWFLLIAFDGASIWLNANFAGDWTKAIIHGLPPLTLVVLLKLYTADIKTEARHVAAERKLDELAKAAGERRQEVDELAAKIADLAAKKDKLTDDIRQLQADKRGAKKAKSSIFVPGDPERLAEAREVKQDKIEVRRRQVLDMLTQGLDKAAIAQELGVSTRTIGRDIKSLNGAALEVVL